MNVVNIFVEMFLALTDAVIVIDTVYSIKELMINFSCSSRLNHWHWGNRKIYPVREITWKVWGRISDSVGSTKHTHTSIPRMPCIFTKNLLKLVPKGPIDIKPALVQIIAWCKRQAIIWTKADPIHWRIYATLGGAELTTTKPGQNVTESKTCAYFLGVI